MTFAVVQKGEKMSDLITSQMRRYLINRQEAIDAAIAAVNEFDNSCNLTRSDMIADAINNAAPSAPLTLFGYDIEHLAFIAKVMQEKDLAPEQVINLLKDNGYAVELVINSLKDSLHKAGISHKNIAHKINLHQYPAAWICSSCGSKHFDFSDKYCSYCGADVRVNKDE